ncbi:MAG: hypothetical protein ACR2GU_10890 [Rubrobacteraceae bacterium]
MATSAFPVVDGLDPVPDPDLVLAGVLPFLRSRRRPSSILLTRPTCWARRVLVSPISGAIIQSNVGDVNYVRTLSFEEEAWSFGRLQG